jgi:hypothetical protein
VLTIASLFGPLKKRFVWGKSMIRSANIRFLRSFPPALAILVGGGAAAQSPESVVTELVKGRCRFVSIDKETNEEQVKRCPGIGGVDAVTRASHTNVFLGFQWAKSREPQEVVYGWSLGEKVEWRGVRDRKGLRPYAAIVRVIVKDPETLVAGGQVLAVVRLQSGKACVAALADASANANANELARAAADSIARNFDCAKGRPSVVGAPTPRTEGLLKQLQEASELR